jgi:hypothetical protein
VTTQGEQATVPAPQQQGTHHFVMTLQRPIGSGFTMGTFSNHITPAPVMTRHDVYQAIKQEIGQADPDFTDATVVFFSLEPNQL